MTARINQFPSIQQMTEGLQKVREQSKPQAPLGTSFAQVLEKAGSTGNLKLSKHAGSRLETRNIDLSGEQWKRLELGVSKAEAKGIKESLIMVDNLAFIVNVASSTVITAVSDSDDKVFTNIDGAVIA